MYDPSLLNFERIKLVHYERTKLTANLLNTIASASIVVGVITPAALAVAAIQNRADPPWGQLLGALIWIPVGLVLHALARRVLGRLRPMIGFLAFATPAIILVIVGLGVERALLFAERRRKRIGEPGSRTNAAAAKMTQETSKSRSV